MQQTEHCIAMVLVLFVVAVMIIGSHAHGVASTVHHVLSDNAQGITIWQMPICFFQMLYLW